MTDWQLPRVSDFDWSAEAPGISREEWVAADGGFWVYPPAAGDEPVWFPDGGADPVLSMFSALLDIMPFVGEAKDLVQLFTGTDFITGERLSWWQRIIGLAGPLDMILKRVKSGAAILKAARPIVSAADVADLLLDFLPLLQGSASTIPLAARLAEASVQLREGVDINALEWRDETTAILNVGALEAQRLTDKLAAQYPLTPQQAVQVREILVKTFIRQAQLDGLLPKRMEVLPSVAEGGDPSETIDVRDPMTGTSWDVSDSGVAVSPGASPASP